MKSIGFLDNISKVSLYFLAFLFPLWFLPITQDILHFQKQALLVVFVLISLVAWLAKTVSKGELAVKAGWFNVPVLAVLFAAAASTIVSLWRYGSFWGWPLSVSDSFLTISMFALLYFLVVNSIEEGKGLFQLFFSFIVSSVLAGIFTILQLYQVFLLPFQFAKAASFNTIGSSGSVAIIAAVLLPLTLVMAFASKVLLRWIFWIIAALFLAIMLLINTSTAWIVLTAGLLVLLAFGMWNLRKRTEFGWVSFPMALLIVALFFMTFRVAVPGSPTAPFEVSQSSSAEISMLQQTFQQSPAFGTGPGTFVFDYAKYHPAVLNQTIFWGTRFASGASEILDWFVTKGIAGGLAFLAVIIAAIILGARALLNAKGDTFSWMLGLGTLASFVGIAVAQGLYSSNLTLSFLFWLLLGGLGAVAAGASKKISIAPPSFLAVVSSFTFLLVLIFGVGLLFIGGQKYAAEIQYLKGAQAANANDAQNGMAKILSAAQLNPSVDLYWRDISQLYLGQFNQIVANPNLTDDQKKQGQDALSNALTAAKQAVALNPANVENWNVQGFVARSFIGIAAGADAFAVSSYQKVIDLEPASPFSWTELGRVYLLQAQSLVNQKDTKAAQDEALTKALENLNKAVALKQDYAPAHYLIAVIYDQQGKSDAAISKLEETKVIAPQDVGLAFQLGVLYYQKNDFAKAQAEFERAKGLNANYANARYMLGLVYDKQKQKDKAITEFTKVLELNPGNEQITKILGNLNAGKPALTGIQQSQPPIQENPREIQK